MSSSVEAPKKLSPFLGDERIISVQFSELPRESDDPDNYQQKIKFWRDCMLFYAQEKHVISFSVFDIEHFFQRPDGLTPECIEQVVIALVRQQIIGCCHYELDHYSPDRGVVINALASLFSFFAPARSDSELASYSPFFFYSRLKDATSMVYDHLREVCYSSLEGATWTNSIIPFDVFVHVTSDIISLPNDYSTSIDLQLIEKALIDSKKIIVFHSGGVKYFKLSRDSTTNVKTVNETDRAIALLKRAMSRIDALQLSLQEQINSKLEEARRLVRTNDKDTAKKTLAFRHHLVSLLQNRTGARNNIERILVAFETLESDQELANAMSTSASVLKEVGLDLDAIHRTIDEAAEVLEQQQEVSNALSEDISSENQSMDDEEIEKEYEKLLDNSNDVTTELKVVEENNIVINELPATSIVFPSPPTFTFPLPFAIHSNNSKETKTAARESSQREMLFS